MQRVKTVLEWVTTVVLLSLAVFMVWQRIPATKPSPIAAVHGTIEAAAITQTLGHGPIWLVEFADFQCPYCARFESDIWPEVKQTLVDTGRITFAPIDFPLPMHPFAKPAAAVAACAGVQGKYWDARPVIFSTIKAGTFSPEGIARAVDYEPCQSPSSTDPHQTLGTRLGVTGTPTFFLGTHQASGEIRVSEKIVGIPLAETLRQLVTTMER